MEHKDVPYIVFESNMARNERQTKRFTVALAICVILIFLSNAIWLYAWCQYDYTGTETTYTQDGEGINVIGDSNDVTDESSKN